MGQRDGFASSDVSKINKMYKCSNTPTQGIINRPTYPRPTIQKPIRPIAGGSAGGGGYTNPLAQVIGNIGGFFQALGGKHDENETFDGSNNIGET